mmetsp:Transcript_6233/g.9094  ORF Transcript_6233/g.9094 Transcript_6233/m.9094 type:complete len:249 (-) Transcript_6233:591-1337(-)|eukprot:CAMPEP_0196812668 /NCGR_PEP_ID=MMETSP1362-20130617/29225_1 /TAXON_ID=163516 /ORGANISM="Leptocylindrus danicus, Strain CCMP1856" /LENGTH=248 /DNA_ID=CAMNT_0042188459 /DNA_START=59 /DNA_END=805 /DNA_ORIENTATION=+
MFDVSSGELIVLAGVGIALIGRKDLPMMSRALGDKVGRIVGLLQGARARGAQFIAESESNRKNDALNSGLKELRAGLRELDAVKSELAIAASTGMRGFENQHHHTVSATSSRARAHLPVDASSAITTNNKTADNVVYQPAAASGEEYLKAAASSEAALPNPSTTNLAPRSQSVAAIAEEEWVKKGVGFRATAEQVNWGSRGGPSTGGSALLNDIIQESLIHDQYDRVTAEQDELLKSKIRGAIPSSQK